MANVFFFHLCTYLPLLLPKDGLFPLPLASLTLSLAFPKRMGGANVDLLWLMPVVLAASCSTGCLSREVRKASCFILRSSVLEYVWYKGE